MRSRVDIITAFDQLPYRLVGKWLSRCVPHRFDDPVLEGAVFGICKVHDPVAGKDLEFVVAEHFA